MAPMSPAMMGSASAAPPMGQGAGPPDASGAMPDLMGKIRQVATSVDDLGSSNPALAPEIQQIKVVLRQMIIKAAQAASAQSPSGEAVPMGGG